MPPDAGLGINLGYTTPPQNPALGTNLGYGLPSQNGALAATPDPPCHWKAPALVPLPVRQHPEAHRDVPWHFLPSFRQPGPAQAVGIEDHLQRALKLADAASVGSTD